MLFILASLLIFKLYIHERNSKHNNNGFFGKRVVFEENIQKMRINYIQFDRFRRESPS
jgi:hypothetical protein